MRGTMPLMFSHVTFETEPCWWWAGAAESPVLPRARPAAAAPFRSGPLPATAGWLGDLIQCSAAKVFAWEGVIW